jgi:5-hydroxyisourate hydrolase-like protein (transthyretin family)
MRITNSSTGKPARSLTLKMARMRKDMQLEFGVTMEVEDNNGKLCILIKLIKTEQRE